ncbi:SDR family NAD(P)-dependent oxidoreductase [Pseudenhygromyxa sp. WMMC2535]|uniref:SDR family NAD(P)-dependent oxidoreductase n=1 Tax=Pseudenhygromyxa sp. WMMC2535 TaxID=2712867 RepID=UPI00155789A3|nr:SDR family NAD(P)-dependent oxidoreductase [Pseudenhygromyxa sp. WMMC2535]NVB40696.1 SDR family NAD(P)-dependent oxidoreductase [Pseudenhygromyxa sp. WMMC2535]
MTTQRQILEQVQAGQLSYIEAYERLSQVPLSPRSAREARGSGRAPAPEQPAPEQPSPRASAPALDSSRVAVIGISGRFPGAPDLDALWTMLREGRSAITEVPAQRWNHAEIYDPEAKQRGRTYARRGGFVADIDRFDARFFRLSPREARFLDPQQRVFLQECWRAIEDAGYAADALAGSRTGIFVGCKGADYQLRLQSQDLSALDVTDSHLFGGNDISMLPARAAYFLDLRGPAIPINTACSSSMVALHLACESLASGQCELAIAAGVEFMTTPGLFVSMASSDALSRSGSCNAFSNDSDGLVLGEGACVVLLKPLDRALADGDPIHGVIRASGINQDGKSAGINAPNGAAQTALEVAVYERAGVDPAQISYVEAHGTATALGDPIEYHALTDAFRQFTDRAGYCPIGTIKTNIGHPLSTAGLAGLAKVLLSLRHEQLPPSLNFHGFNRLIDAEGSPFFVNTSLRPWPRRADAPRIAAISSFGFSGTNAHILVEEAPAPAPREPRAAGEPQLILLSARTQTALAARLRSLLDLCQGPEAGALELADLAHTLHRGRVHMRWRIAWVVDDLDELRAQLSAALAQPSCGRELAPPSQAQRGLFDKLGALLASSALDRGSRRGALVALADLYTSGLVCAWALLHDPASARRLRLPTYTFDERGYWLDAPTSSLLWPPLEQAGRAEPAAPAAPAHPAPEPAATTCYFEARWRPYPLLPEGPRSADVVGDLLVLDDDGRLSARLRAAAPRRRLIRVCASDRTHATEDGWRCRVDAAGRWDWEALLTAMREAGVRPAQLIFAPADTADTTNQANPAGGALALLGLCRALLRAPASAAKTVDILVPHREHAGLPTPANAAFGAFARTLAVESRRVRCRSVGFGDDIDAARLLSELDDFAREAPEVRWHAGERRAPTLVRAHQPAPTPNTEGLRRGGVFLLTGGCGGIGSRLAAHLCQAHGARLVLTGRAEAPPPGLLDELRARGGEAIYLRCDLGVAAEVEALLAQVRARFGRVDGVFHLAGALADALVVNKRPEDAAATFAAKVSGLEHLDRATRDDDLAHFVVFSSLAAVRGNPGQADYAYANAFMDAFVRRRERQRLTGERSGRSLAIQWPQWDGPGMRLAPEVRELMASLGMHELPFAAGVEALELLLRSEAPVVAVAHGDPEALTRLMAPPPSASPEASSPRQDAPDYDPRALEGAVTRLLARIFAEVTEIPLSEIDPALSFEEYGVDSVMVKSLNVKLVRELGELPKTLMFECQTLGELGTLLVEQHADALASRLGLASPASSPELAQAPRDDRRTDLPAPAPVEPAPAPSFRARAHASSEPAPAEPGQHRARASSAQVEGLDIAVVGLAGRYPDAPDLDIFWRNLCAGHDAISEVPATRWEVERFFDPDPQTAAKGKSYCKWGGFLDDIDRFDAAFFRISPREAETMDPQERLFLECAWQAFEDSGHRFPLASPRKRPSQAKVGVFVGVTTNTYQLYGPEQWAKGNYEAHPSSSPWSIANRVSYLFGLEGPSMVVDTACSSSLVALHLACESIARGECEAALVGGVNLYTHPAKYVVMSRMHMLSRSGRCHTFGAGADGFVPGEGVGAVLLKPYAAALRDGDAIRARVRGSAVNHGGKTTSYTVPNPSAQAELIHAALTRAGVDPRSVGYVEAHGTGTELGDPIELRGLDRGYGSPATEGAELPDCAIGSVKSNIGHLEAAAGIAGLTKIVLQLQHRTLVPSLHADPPNPNLDFSASRFRVQRALAPWPAPDSGPRRAALSSFGAGGTNAHLILEEAPGLVEDQSPARHDAPQLAQLIVLSAASRGRLRASARALLRFVEAQRAGDPSARLCDLAYTLQVGRDAMAERFAVEVDSWASLAHALRPLAQDSAAVTAKPGRDGHKRELLERLLEGEEGAAFLDGLCRARKLTKLGLLWVEGAELDWSRLHDGPRQRLALPSAPFQGRRYWFQTHSGHGHNLDHSGQRPHPMLLANRTTLSGLRYEIALDPQDYWFRDHIVFAEPVIPGVGLLELAQAAGSLVSERPVTRLRRVAWLEPLAISATATEQRSHIELEPRADALAFEVDSRSEDARRVHARGLLDWAPPSSASPTRLELAAIRERCGAPLAAAALYPDAESVAADAAPPVRIGPSLRSIHTLWVGEDEVLVRLEQPVDAASEQRLQVAMLDGAVQASVAFGGLDRLASRSLFPLSIDALEIHAPIPARAYAHLRLVATTGDARRGTARFDITIVDDEGRPVVDIRGYVARVLALREAEPTSLLLEPAWTPLRSPSPARAQATASPGAALLIGADPALATAMSAAMPGVPLICAEAGPDFSARSGEGSLASRVALRLGHAGDLRRLVELAQSHAQSHAQSGPLWIVLASTLAERAPLDETSDAATALDAPLEAGLFTLYGLAAALLEGGDATGRNPAGGNAAGARSPAARACVVIATRSPEGREHPVHASLGAFTRSANQERSALRFTRLDLVDPLAPPQLAAQVVAALADMSAGDDDTLEPERRVRDGLRWRRSLRELGVGEADVAPPWSELLPPAPRVVIAGGTGGLGLAIAEDLAPLEGARLLLLGRSPGDHVRVRAALERLRQRGAEVEYAALELADDGRLSSRLAAQRERWGAFDLVVHAAGELLEGYVGERPREQVEAVLAARVRGTVALDRATAGDPLARFVLCSSLSAVLGNPAQTDSAFAHAFMAHFASWRDAAVAAGTRAGASLTIDWPLWEVGRVGDVSPQVLVWLEQTLGVRRLHADEGLALLRRGLASGRPRLAALAGDLPRIRRQLLDDGSTRPAASRASQAPSAPTSAAATPSAAPSAPASEDPKRLTAEVTAELRRIAAELLKLPLDELDVDADLAHFGFESITTIDFTNALNRRYGVDAMPTMFFESRTLASVASQLIAEFPEAVAAHHGPAPALAPIQAQAQPPSTPTLAREPAEDPLASPWLAAAAPAATVEPARPQPAARLVDEPVAIIGMSGAMPGSPDLEAFWANLVEDRELVVEVPEERWRWRDHATDKFSPRWAGLMDEVDHFDPLFFGVSPREAALMDPQHRLVLEHGWRALEDAGVRPSSLAGSRTGVFVGVANADYADLVRERLPEMEAHGALGLSQCILPNRLSFMLDLRGPSEPVNTGCSSAVVAIHRAVEAIRSDRCTLALAGGVHVLLNPLVPVFFGHAGALSADHRVRAFDRGASGTLLGEGVGMIALKPLSAALADGNPIHAIIRGVGENHGGHASSLTAPNPEAQVELIESVYTAADVDPATVDYVEAHGTGTLLGDPIELKALREAFTRLHAARGRALPSEPAIAVSSVKSNIGHLMTAAGIASVFKVVLAFAHHRQPGTRHFEALNSFVDLRRSPFTVRAEHRPWPAPTDALGQPRPRRASVSSFGMGGANAHLILEEHIEARPRLADPRAQLVPISAKTPERLQAQLLALREAITAWPADPAALAEIAFTLQTGRDAMPARVAILAEDLDQLGEALDAALAGREHPRCWRGALQPEPRRRPSQDPSLAPLLAARTLSELAQRWAAGAELDWLALWPDQRPRLVHLPTYAFAPMRCWLSPSGETIFEPAQPVRPDQVDQVDQVDQPGPRPAYYGYRWRPAPLAAPTGDATPPAPALIFDAAGASLASAGLDGPREALDIELTREPSYEEALRRLHERGLLPAQVVLTSAFAGDPIDALFFIFRGYAALKQKRALEQVMIAYPLEPGREQGERAGFEALAGYGAALPTIFPRARLTLVGLDAAALERELALLTAELDAREAGEPSLELRYRGALRERRRATALPIPPASAATTKDSASERPVVLITGGLGGLGLIFARYYAQRYHARLALLGRSALDEGKRAALAELEALGGEVIYLRADVSDPTQLEAAVADARARFGPLEVVLHSAGVANQLPLTQKDHQRFRSTLAPKLEGTRSLDALTREDPLRLFALFSSTSVQFGDMGQGDYAVGNRYMDAFAGQRASEGAPGHSLAINWPLWREGGFRLEGADEAAALEFSGMAYLEIPAGLEAFEVARGLGEHQVIVVVPKQRARIERFLGVTDESPAPLAAKPPRAAATRAARPAGEAPAPAPTQPSSAPNSAPNTDLTERLIAELTALASGVLDLDAAQIPPQADLIGFGLDSIKVAEFISALNERFFALDLNQTEIFGRQTIAEIAEHLLAEHGDALAAELAPERSPEHSRGEQPPAAAASAKGRPRLAPELVPLQRPAAPAAPPSFWIPGSYGFSQSFVNLPEVLGPEQAIYAFHARGNDGKRMPFHRLEDMVAHYIESARAAEPGGGWRLGGYSFGGLVAFEMAQQLARAGEPPAALVLFDTYPPTQWIYDMTQREADVTAMMLTLANFLTGYGEDAQRILPADLEGVPPRLHIARLVELIHERGKTKLPADELFGIFRGSSEVNDYASEVYRSYEPAPYTASAVLYVRAGAGLDPYIADYDYLDVWRALIPALEVIEAPFSHAKLMQPPALAHVGEALRDFFNR